VAIGQILKFSGAGIEKYDAVQSELGWTDGKGEPAGLIAHAAGPTDDGFCVIEWWQSASDWDTFFSQRLRPAFEKVGDIPPPDVTTFEVHNSYTAQ